MKCLLIKRLDGGVSILTQETEALCLEHFEKWKTVQSAHELDESHRFIEYSEYELKANSTKADFRNAWCDVTEEPAIDIDLAKAKECQLEKLRVNRQQAFIDLGFPQKLSPEVEEAILSSETKEKLKTLRDATEPLKALEVSGYNDKAVLDQLKSLAALPKFD